MAVRSDTLQPKRGLSTPLLTTFSLNWETTLYLILFILAAVTRFYDLGARVMSHDESLHTVYSWNLYAGKGYQHDPLMHGPFLFHINALMYFLFGDSDYTARISAALFGTVLVILPYGFRPWLGRTGALAAAVMLLISPGILYYSRYIRNEAYVNVFTVLMVLAFFQYMRTHAGRWLYIGAVAVILMISSKEVAYIHGFIGATFIALAWMWENISDPRYRRIAIGVAGGILLLGIVIAYLSSHPGIFSGAAAAEGETTSFLQESVGLLIKFSGLIIGVMVVWLGIDRQNKPVTLAILSLGERLPELIKAVILAVIIFVVLHTTLFTNIYGLVSGTYGAVSYWLAQQEVERGSQPWYYYFFLIPMYEFLPLLIGGFGGLVYLLRRKTLPAFADAELTEVSTSTSKSSDLAVPSPSTLWPSDGGMFAAFLIFWTLNSFTIYSWAGEKMPWLSVHMTLPLIFLAAHVIQAVLSRFDWAEARQRGGWVLAGIVLLTIPALVAVLAARPFQGQSIQDINETSQFIAGGIALILLGFGLWRYGRQLGQALTQGTAFVVALLVLGLLTIRFAWLLTYVNYDYVNEFLVYAHASPDVKLALAQIDDISERTVGDKMVKIAYDNDSTWPLEWYLREYPNRVYYADTPTREALDAPVVIVGSANESKVKPFLGDKYLRYDYRLVWWPVEDYKNITLAKLWQNYIAGPPAADPAIDTAEAQAARRQVVRDNWRKLWKIFFYRDYEDYNLNEWPFVHRFYLYIRKDVANEVWNYQSGPVELTQSPSLDPYEGKRVETQALKVWGSNGSGEGQFIAPRDLAIGPDGSIYVADSGNHRIQLFDPEGNFLVSWGSEGAGPGQFSEPWGIAVGPEGTVYVADTWNHRLQAFSRTGEFLWQTGTFFNAQGNAQESPGNFWGPRDIAVDAQGSLYVTDTGNKRVQKFSPNGEFIQLWGGGGIVPGAFEEPVGIAIDSQGNIYVADTWNRRIQKFDANFKPLAEWPVAGWVGESVVNKPYIMVDGQNRMIISDPEGYRLIAYDSNGQVLVTWGQYGQDLASFALPQGLAVDAEGFIWVTDADNNRVMRFAMPQVGPQSQAPADGE